MVSQRHDSLLAPAVRGRFSSWLGWAVLIVFLAWAVLASLAVAHLDRRLENFRQELAEERAEGQQLRREGLESRESIENGLREYESLRGRAGELLNSLCRNEKAPDSIAQVMDILKRLGPAVYGGLLSEEELLRATRRLQALGSGSAQGPVQSVEWVKGLRILATKGFFSESRVPEAVDLVGRELYAEATARVVPVPPSPPPEPGLSAPAPETPKEAGAGLPSVSFRSAPARFEVTFPSDWTIKDAQNPNAVLAQSPRLNQGLIDRGYAALSGVQIKQDLLEEEYARQRLVSLQGDNPGFRVEREGAIPLSGAPAQFVLGVHGLGAQEMKTLSVVAVRNEIGYWLTFRARSDLFPRLEPAFLEILSAFRIQP